MTAKKSPKIFSDFWQLSTLIANLSGTDQQIENRNSSWKSTTPPTLDEKKLVYFGPQTKTLLSLINVHPNGLFSGDYILALRGCCALKFLQALKLTKPQGGMGSPKRSRQFKIWPKIQRFKVNNFRASGVSSRDFFQSMSRGAWMITWVQFFTTPIPKNFWRQKIVQNSAQFSTTYDFDREYLRNGSTYRKSEKFLKIYNPSHVRRKRAGVLWSTNEKVIDLNKFTS